MYLAVNADVLVLTELGAVRTSFHAWASSCWSVSAEDGLADFTFRLIGSPRFPATAFLNVVGHIDGVADVVVITAVPGPVLPGPAILVGCRLPGSPQPVRSRASGSFR